MEKDSKTRLLDHLDRKLNQAPETSFIVVNKCTYLKICSDYQNRFRKPYPVFLDEYRLIPIVILSRDEGAGIYFLDLVKTAPKSV